MTLIVTIAETYGKHDEIRSEHRTDDDLIAMSRAIRQAYGRGAYLHRDQGLAEYGIYGQIVRDVRNGVGWSAMTLTGTVRINIEPKEE